MQGEDLEARLGQAIRGGGLRLHYQPLVALPSGCPTGAEALARWHDVDLGTVSPAVFIPVAERTGLVHDLGRWVLREACHAAMRWDPQAGGPSVSVNISPVQLARTDITDEVNEALVDSGLAPPRLTLEVTETAAVVDLEATSARLSKLRDLGVRIALDDFGTGFSSLTMLRRLPLDQVKIDRSFVAGVHVSAQDAVVVRLAVDAAHLLGQTVCAEGVESVEQARQLVAMGCDAAQGWYFGRPLPDSPGLAELEQRLTLHAQGAGERPPVTPAAVPDLVTAISPDGLIRYASASSLAVLGHRPEALVGAPVDDFALPGDSLLGAPSVVEESTEGSLVRRVRHADGGYRWLSTSVHELRDGSGHIKEYVATSRDITALIETRERLEAVEEQFRGAFDGAPIGMALSDLTGRIVRINSALAALIGYRPDDLVGRTIDDLTWPEDRAADARNLGLLATRSERSQRVRKRYLNKDGCAVPVEVWAATVESRDGLPRLVVAHVMPTADAPQECGLTA